MATKKVKKRRSPRQVWTVIDGNGDIGGAYRTRAEAMRARITDAFDPTYNDRVIGPFALTADSERPDQDG